MNEVFRPAGNIEINARYSYLKLNHVKLSFLKNQYETKRLLFYCTCYMEQISRNFQKTKNLNTSKQKRNTNICMTSPIQIYGKLVDLIMLWLSLNIFLFVKQILIYIFSASLWLKYHNENNSIRLFCFTLVILIFFCSD